MIKVRDTSSMDGQNNPPQDRDKGKVPQSASPKKAGKRKSNRAASRTVRVLRKLLIPILCLIALFIGLVAGYVYLGGKPFSDVFHISTWKHLFDLIFA